MGTFEEVSPQEVCFHPANVCDLSQSLLVPGYNKHLVSYLFIYFFTGLLT